MLEIGRLPRHAPGLRIGLLGGSFDPPHEAHRAISLFAMKRLRLDRVWWLVTPGNPLKNTTGLAPLEHRLAAAGALARHPRIDVTGIEAAIGTSYSHATIAWLKARCSGVHFVWIMGADNLENFHRWRNWQTIFRQIPIAVVDRGGIGLKVFAAPATRAFATARQAESQALQLPIRRPPAWTLLHGLKSPLSSTALRNGRGT